MELQVQIVKLAARGSTARPLEPQATLRAKIAARGSTARPLEPQATLHAKIAAPGITLVPPLPPARLAPQERFSLTLSPVTSL